MLRGHRAVPVEYNDRPAARHCRRRLLDFALLGAAQPFCNNALAVSFLVVANLHQCTVDRRGVAPNESGATHRRHLQ